MWVQIWFCAGGCPLAYRTRGPDRVRCLQVTLVGVGHGGFHFPFGVLSCL